MAPTAMVLENLSRRRGRGPKTARTGLVGTASTYGQAGGVVIVNPPPGSTADDHWVSIGRSDNTQPVTGMVCNLSQTARPGKYNFTVAIYIYI
jgi:hypothetical protein